MDPLPQSMLCLLLLVMCGEVLGLNLLARIKPDTGDGRTYGTVEVRHQHSDWGTVCDDIWNNLNANVLCRMLGFGSAYEYYTKAKYGSGTGHIWLDNVNCQGSENNIGQCPANSWGSHNCDHSEDAGIRCTSFDPSTSVVRLTGETYRSGRVEVKRGSAGQWGTICHRGWNIQDATVVCRSLGFTSAESAGVGAPTGNLPVWLDNVQCSGKEKNLRECRISWWGSHSCSSGWNAQVTCANSSSIVVRLAGGTYRSGKVEVKLGSVGQWGSICNRGWDLNAAKVTCRMIGFTSAISVTGAADAQRTANMTMWLDNIQCTGTEENLGYCRTAFSWGNHSCDGGQDAQVVCTNPLMVRLAGGTYHSGRVEVKLGSAGQWGTICDRGWDLNDANVVCRMIGFTLARFVTGAVRAQRSDSRTMLLNDVQCSGTEKSLGECRTAYSWGNNSCDGGQDAQVVCSNLSSIAVRLAGETYRSGRVEVKLGSAGQWGTICHRGWGIQDATVVCRTLGFASAEDTISAVHSHGADTKSAIWLHNVQCNGSEERLEECQSDSWGNHSCDEGQSAQVVCSNPLIEVRLEGGSFSSGRVEVRSSNSSKWGTICDRRWDMRDAHVVCRMLGFTSAEAGVTAVAKGYGKASGPIWLDNVQCTGQELNLHSCPTLNSWGIQNCTHEEDAGVVCTRLEVRLAGKRATDRAGRVEVRRAGTGEEWGTVCDDGWSIKEAHVVCRMLGFSGAERFVEEAGFGSGTTSIYLDDVSCSGREVALGAGCTFNSWGVHDCGHSEDVGVVCTESVIQPQRKPDK